MSDLISGKEALIALANGEKVEYNIDGKWMKIQESLSWLYILNDCHKLRLKPQTITINGIEVPAPFKPEDGDYVYVISDQSENGRIKTKHKSDFSYVLGAWRTEDEIKQVVEALRKIFN